MKRIYALEYFELAFYLGGVLLLEHDGDHIVPKSLYMKSLVNAVIGDHFSLYDTGNELNNGETLSLNVIKMNRCVGNHLTGLPFIKNVPRETGGFVSTMVLTSKLTMCKTVYRSGNRTPDPSNYAALLYHWS